MFGCQIKLKYLKSKKLIESSSGLSKLLNATWAKQWIFILFKYQVGSYLIRSLKMLLFSWPSPKWFSIKYVLVGRFAYFDHLFNFISFIRIQSDPIKQRPLYNYSKNPFHSSKDNKIKLTDCKFPRNMSDYFFNGYSPFH